MKNFLPSSIISMTAVIAGIMLTACSRDLTFQEAANKNASTIQDPQQLKDANFLIEAKSFNILERQLNEHALNTGYSSAVVNLAKTNLAHHEDLAEDLEDLADDKDIVMPSKMKGEHRELLEEIVDTSREDFDQIFIRTLRRINEENTYLYKDKATEASDADIRAFAARKLDMLRSHADEIAEVDEQLLQTFGDRD